MPVLPRIAEFTLRFWNSGKAFHISQRYWKWLLSLIGMSGISDIHNNYCVLCREQLSLKHIQNSLFFFFNIISSFFSGSQALSALQSIFFIKTRQLSHFKHPVPQCVCVRVYTRGLQYE